MIDIRTVSCADIDRICAHRHAMFAEAGKDEAALATMSQPSRTWLAAHIESGRYFGFFAEASGEVIGGIGLMIIDWPPHPAHPQADRRGYVLNVFIEPEWRGQGVARRLMERGEDELRARGISYAILHATEAGRPLYDRMGWAQTSEMAKLL